MVYIYIHFYISPVSPFRPIDQVHGGTTFANHALGMVESEDVGDAKMGCHDEIDLWKAPRTLIPIP